MEYSELKKRHFGTNDTDKKFNDEEIISSLEVIATKGNCDECKIRNCKWGTCNCSQITANAALDLTNHLQAENERLKKKVEELSEVLSDSIRIRYKEVQSEAYKECLAKVKNYIKTHCNPYGKPDFDYDTSIKILNFIDNLVKEMVGEEE